ncbi:MAG: hypothetical protein IJ083_03265 [Clostridia bacterium]|nr:hypothetical protein [Clostridia bacterium]
MKATSNRRYRILDCKWDMTRGGYACGPVPASIAATVQYDDGDEQGWLHFVEVDGVLNTFLSPEDMHDLIVEEDYSDEDLRLINSRLIREFGGIPLGDGEYERLYEGLRHSKNESLNGVLRLLLALLAEEEEVADELCEAAKGKFADEIEIPITEGESDYLDGIDEDLDEDMDEQ